jgi:hypothetical protein
MRLYVPDDVLEEASAARYQMLPIKSKLRYQKELEKFTQWQLLLDIILNIQILLIKLNFNYT